MNMKFYSMIPLSGLGRKGGESVLPRVGAPYTAGELPAARTEGLAPPILPRGCRDFDFHSLCDTLMPVEPGRKMRPVFLYKQSAEAVQ